MHMLTHNRPHLDSRKALQGLHRNRIGLFVMAALAQAPVTALAAPAPEPSASPEPGPRAVEFSPAFLGIGGTNVDVSRFERGNPILPGDYRVDLYVNEYRVAREQLGFRDTAGSDSAHACFNRSLLERMNVDVARLEEAGTSLDGDCLDLQALIPDAQVAFDVGALRLDVSVPQVNMLRHARGYVSPDLWDQGITAFSLGYNFNAYRTENRGAGSDLNAYLGLNSGLNISGWRLRNQSSLRWGDGGEGSDFQNVATYAQHDITAWQSQLTLGDSFTSGQLFDSTPFRGLSVGTDDRMRPDSMSGYAPLVRGMAETNAKVEIRQNGYVIYEATVAPGAFEINDLYATGYGGDLEVTVVEADGRERKFTVPYASVPQLLRPGTWRYAATAGQVRNDALATNAPYFLEGTYQRGFNNWFTAYTGLQVSDGDLYRNVMLGTAFNTPVGAVSVDLSRSSTRFHGDGGDQDGYSARVTYSKSIPATNTDFALAAYRYSSEGYLSLADAVVLDDRVRTGELAGGVQEGAGRQRSRFQVTLNQRLGERAGSLYLSGSRNDYWDIGPVDTSYQVGYNNRFRSLSYSVTASHTRDVMGRYDNQYYLSFSVPLGRPSARHRTPQLNVSAGHDQDGNSVRAGVTGSAGQRNQVNYSVNVSGRGYDEANVNASTSWRTPYATLGATYGYADDHNQASVSASGALVVHAGGVTLSQQLGETIGIVQAKGATGARLNSDSSTRVDGRGYAVVSNLMPYRLNDVSLNPNGISYDVELDNTRLQVAPRAGAVVSLRYETTTGRAMLIRARTVGGMVIPFGADVADAHGNSIGAVGQGGQAFARSQESQGVLKVRWGNAADQQCSISYSLPQSGGEAISLVDAECR